MLQSHLSIDSLPNFLYILRTNSMRSQFFFVLLLVAYASAECCKRKADYGCCGKSPGSCGVFCCNCGGCNKQCEYSTCATLIWMRCSGAIDKCIDKCGNKDSEDCKACLKDDYASCKDCIVTADKLKGFEVSSSSTRFMGCRYYQAVASPCLLLL